MKKSNRQVIAKLLSASLNWFIVAVVFWLPVFFLPTTSETLFLPKHLLLFAAAALALILWTAIFVLRGKVVVTLSPLLLPMFLLAAALVASALVSKSPLPEAALGRLGLAMAGFGLLLVGSSRPAKIAPLLVIAVVAAAGVLGLHALAVQTGAIAGLGLASQLGGQGFTLAGTMITLVIAAAAALPLAIGQIRQIGQINPLRRVGFLIAAAAIAVGLVIGLINAAPQFTSGSAMPIGIGWQVAVETLKEQPFFGSGVGSYLAAYTKYRPLVSNSGALWTQRHQQGPNEILHLFTESGLAGLAALGLVILGVVKLAKLGELSELGKRPAALSALILLASLLVAPLSVVTWSLLVAVMIILTLEAKLPASNADTSADQVYNATLGLVALREGGVRLDRAPEPDPLDAGDSFFAKLARGLPGRAAATSEGASGILSWVFFVPALAIGALSLVAVGRVYAAEISYRQALLAIAANDGTRAYNKLIETITRNPWFDNYHRQYADVNLRLANSLAAQRDLSDQDRNNVSQLIQQAIREGKIAVQLDPADVRNWETLAVIYRALINVASGAQDWTILTYTEAIRRDPINPLLRVELGGIFYNARDWDSAIQTFQTAANLKNDYANAYYNLALAYEQDGRTREAFRAMQATLQTLDAKSPDYPAAQAKLEELAKKQSPASPASPTGEEAGSSQERLAAPSPFPTPLPGTNRVQLDEESAPPVTPTPTAEPTSTPLEATTAPTP